MPAGRFVGKRTEGGFGNLASLAFRSTNEGVAKFAYPKATPSHIRRFQSGDVVPSMANASCAINRSDLKCFRCGHALRGKRLLIKF